MQKIHSGGSDGKRYFWNVTLASGESGEYRSRHSTVSGVRNELQKHGNKVVRISAAKR